MKVKSWNEDDAPSDGAQEMKDVTNAICRYGRRGLFQQARDAFYTAETKDAIMYSAIIGAAANCRELEEGMAFFQEIQESSLETSDSVYSATLKLLGNTGKYDEAGRIWKDLVESGKLESSTKKQSCLTGLLNAAVATGSVDTVQKEMDAAETRGIELNPSHFGCLLKVCRQAADLETSDKALARMHENFIPINIIHYTIYMGTCTRFVASTRPGYAKAVELEQKVLSMMKEDSVEPNEYFLEEWVALHLGIPSIRQWLREESPPRPGQEEIQGAAKVLEQAITELGLSRFTKGLRDLRDRIPALRDTAAEAYALLQGGAGQLPSSRLGLPDPSDNAVIGPG